MSYLVLSTSQANRLIRSVAKLNDALFAIVGKPVVRKAKRKTRKVRIARKAPKIKA